jgi:hypothetical protein
VRPRQAALGQQLMRDLHAHNLLQADNDDMWMLRANECCATSNAERMMFHQSALAMLCMTKSKGHLIYKRQMS